MVAEGPFPRDPAALPLEPGLVLQWGLSSGRKVVDVRGDRSTNKLLLEIMKDRRSARGDAPLRSLRNFLILLDLHLFLMGIIIEPKSK